MGRSQLQILIHTLARAEDLGDSRILSWVEAHD